MGCVASKKPEPLTPVESSGVSGNLEVSGGILNSALWNRIEVDRSESEESGKVSSNGTDSQSFKLGNFNKHVDGELVAAGWPSWLSAVAREAIQGWVPLKPEAYEKLEKIGQGTYSSVFKARELETGRFVALKKIRFDNFEPESVRFMAREIFIMRRLNHRNIMKLDGLITSRSSCSIYLVFEYMEHDLAGLSSSPEITFSESQVKCYMQQLLSGLEHCHSRSIIHRDIKCANLLVNNEGILKIADFGLSNFFNPSSRQQLTSRVVTLWYRPPELLLGATEYEPTVDLWSVGCVFAELFLKKPVLQGMTEVEQIHKIFKLCGSPSDEYWRKSRLAHETLFKPQQTYPSCLQETFRFLPENAYKLLETFLSIEPQKRGTATSALSSEYFRTMPYACDPSSLPKYSPNKEIDAKNREESLKIKLSGSPEPLEIVRRHPRTIKSQKSSVSSKLSRLEEPWLKAENTQKNAGRQNLAKVNDEAGLFVDMLQKEFVLSADNRFSAPLSLEASIGFVCTKKQASVRSHSKSNSKCDIPRVPDSSNVLKSKNNLDIIAKGEEGCCKFSKVEKPCEIERNLMVHQWVQLGHPELDNHSHNSTDMSCNMHGISSKPSNMGYKKSDDRVEFSAPLLYQSHKLDELLERHEQRIRQAVRRTWLPNDKVF
ncbi:probable serine/threonine-protein kinase At1g54610 [Phalaenopsis equestris]|uniref:probable serine/threonine-protein kinase At1g54610 n=1 Tax=Phalaenopsis equestris TaxID=78828 RepID=UPI0009E3F954|nr:probable serine/threonine-protein kinase At1g54610 [Phalaenopsis equestris]